MKMERKKKIVQQIQCLDIKEKYFLTMINLVILSVEIPGIMVLARFNPLLLTYWGYTVMNAVIFLHTILCNG